MKKYTSSEIVKRALQIADIENTDFLQHREVTQYLNDSWQKVYQWLINKGDKQFVEEVRLSGTGGFGSVIEYDLPDNFYQMLSIRNASGYVIPRKSESESNNSCTYEIVNDKLRLYGCPGNLVMTYWTTPVWITFPDKDVEVNNVKISTDTRAHCKNSIIDTESKLIVNALTGDTIADITTTLTNYSQYSFRLGQGHFTASKVGVTYYFDFDGHLIGSQHNHEYNTQEDFLCGTKVVYMSTSSCVNFMGTKVGEVDFDEENCIIGGDEDVLFNKYGEFNMNWMDAATSTYLNLYHGYMNEIHNNYDLLDVTALGNRTYLFTANKGQFLYVHINEDGTYEWDKLNTIGAQIAPLEYGPLIYTGEHTLKSAYPDTIFNFPNEIYVQLLAADLASRFLMKMNADSSGVDNLYQTMQRTFMNTLNQDANYTRITNAYRS